MAAMLHVTKLPNPAKDAEAMAALLKSAGFEVVSGSDMTRDQMVSRISDFSDLLKNGADAAVIFYAGHGVQINGKNYLVPVDANLHTSYDVKANTIDADDVVDSASNAKVKLVLLDACRNNPFADQLAKGDAKSRSVASNTGLAAMQSAEGTMISFATSPGATALDGEGEHSPFTLALLDNLTKPGVEINDAMTSVRAEVQASTGKQQQPWANTNLTGKFYIAPLDASPATVATTTPATGGVDANQAAVIETTIWQSAEKSGQRDEYALYLEKYPKGRGLYSELAEMRLASLDKTTGASVAPSASATPAASSTPVANVDPSALKSATADQGTEEALALNANDWRQIQLKLTAIGFPTAGANGSVGPTTRKAINSWQIKRGYFSSGYLNKPQHDALALEQPKPAAPSIAASRGAAVATSQRGGSPGRRRQWRRRRRRGLRRRRICGWRRRRRGRQRDVHERARPRHRFWSRRRLGMPSGALLIVFRSGSDASGDDLAGSGAAPGPPDRRVGRPRATQIFDRRSLLGRRRARFCPARATPARFRGRQLGRPQLAAAAAWRPGQERHLRGLGFRLRRGKLLRARRAA